MTILDAPLHAAGPALSPSRVAVTAPVDAARLTRYRGGTYSHTVEKVVFADGNSARTDLIRLNPNVPAYSLDFAGHSPHHAVRYRPGDWSDLPGPRAAAADTEVGWIVRNSYPVLPAAELSRRVRAAGHPIGAAHIAEHEAIAATQAAIWFFTNGLSLDTRPLNVPIAVRRSPQAITFEFDGDPQLGGYSVWARSRVECRLQKSLDGVAWHDVSGSHLGTSGDPGRYRRTLGEGSTLSASSHGRGGRGYRHYRLVTDAAHRVDDVAFWLSGARHYRNSDRVVHLYNYLLAGAEAARADAVAPLLIDRDAVVEDGLVGPFRISTPVTLSCPQGEQVVDADGFALGAATPADEFYLRHRPGTSTARLVTHGAVDLPARVLTAAASDSTGSRFTPVVLAILTEAAIEFDIRWEADER